VIQEEKEVEERMLLRWLIGKQCGYMDCIHAYECCNELSGSITGINFSSS
jgi:hypothetical protein